MPGLVPGIHVDLAARLHLPSAAMSCVEGRDKPGLGLTPSIHPARSTCTTSTGSATTRQPSTRAARGAGSSLCRRSFSPSTTCVAQRSANCRSAQERRNAASKEIGAAMKEKDTRESRSAEGRGRADQGDWPTWKQEEREAIAALDKALTEIPNTPLDDVPEGNDEHDNVEVRAGASRVFDFAPKEHFDIGECLGLMDFESAAKISGARFVVNKGGLARLERALAAFMLDLHTDKHGYTEVNPPLLVRDDAMFGTAQLPKFGEDQFCTVHEPRSLRSRQIASSCGPTAEAGMPSVNRSLAHPHRRSAAHKSRARIASSTKRNFPCA